MLDLVELHQGRLNRASRNEELCGTRVTRGFLKSAHTVNGILVQNFGPKIQAQN
jgi:hypothetical protein